MSLGENKKTDLYIPDGVSEDIALKRTTHMAIVAHHDDGEILANDGILKCFGSNDQWFFAAIVTDGAGSPRDDLYANYTDEDMKKVRINEQKKAAIIGEYTGIAFLNYTSKEVKDQDDLDIISNIGDLIVNTNPEILYTHNLADKHDTHVAVAIKVIKAIRKLPKKNHPKKLYGCEVWRSLDWLNDDEKVYFDVSKHQNISNALMGVFDSQICGGKRYDLATAGRRMANATYSDTHGVDKFESLIYGMDLTPLIEDINLRIVTYIQGYIDRFKDNVIGKLKNFE